MDCSSMMLTLSPLASRLSPPLALSASSRSAASCIRARSLPRSRSTEERLLLFRFREPRERFPLRSFVRSGGMYWVPFRDGLAKVKRETGHCTDPAKYDAESSDRPVLTAVLWGPCQTPGDHKAPKCRSSWRGVPPAGKTEAILGVSNRYCYAAKPAIGCPRTFVGRLLLWVFVADRRCIQNGCIVISRRCRLCR